MLRVIFTHPAVLPQVVRNFQENIRQLQVLCVLWGNAGKAELRPEDIPGNRAGGVAVPFMVYRRDNGFVEILFIFQGAVNRNGQRLFRYPAFSQPVDRIQVPGCSPGQVHSFFHQVDESVPLRGFRPHFHCGIQGVEHRAQDGFIILADLMDDLRQDRGRHPTQDMTVGDGGNLGAEPGDFPDILVPVIEVQADGGRAHHAPAPFAPVDRVLNGSAFPGMERGKAGVSRSAAGKQPRNVHQPGMVVSLRQGEALFLGPEPVKIGKMNIFGIASHDPAHHSPGGSREEPGSGEQGHLGVIGDLRHAVSEGIFRNPLLPVFGKDPFFAHELHFISQRIPSSPADQAAPEPVLASHCCTPSVYEWFSSRRMSSSL